MLYWGPIGPSGPTAPLFRLNLIKATQGPAAPVLFKINLIATPGAKPLVVIN